MIYNQDFVYIHFPKTGGNTVEDYIKNSTEVETAGNHNHFNDLKEIPREKCIFTSIRNPYDWYVSYWNACQGGFGTIGRKAEREGILDYAFKSFSDFLSFFCGGEFAEYGRWTPFLNTKKAIDLDLGLYSIGYYNMFTHKDVVFKNEEQILDKVYLDEQIKTENLEGDLISLLKRFDVNTSYIEYNKVRRNKQRDDSYEKYYDDNMISLVKEKDGFLMKQFNYDF